VRFLGIDPGVSGGLAILDGDYRAAFKMPVTDGDLLDALVGWSDGGVRQVKAVIERAIPFSRPGAKIGVVSAFTSGRGYGRLLMALTAARIPFDEVMPVKWQTALSCRTRGDKNVSKRRAQQLFPALKITHAIADALLLAEYARRTYHREVETDGEKDHARITPRDGTPERPRPRSVVSATRDAS
jgi:hypothetical protein